MKRKLLITVLISLSVLLPFAQSGKDDLKDITAAANSGLADYLAKIPVGKEPQYGFKNRAEFAIAVIGKPYQVNTLGKEFFSDAKLSDKNYLIPTSEYRVPIIINGEYRALLTVAKMQGAWKTVGLGAADLAKEIGGFEKQHPSSNQDRAMLRVYQLHSDFILSTANGSNSPVVYPLASAKIALGKTGENVATYSLSELLPLVKKSINTNKK